VAIKGDENNKQISMNTTVLQNKLSAVQNIYSIAQSLGPAFFEWVDPVATLVVKELMVDSTSSQIRKQSTKILGVLMKCLSDSNQMVALLDMIIPAMVQEINKKLEKLDFNNVKYLLKEVQRMFMQFSNFKGAFITSPEVKVPELINFIVKILNT